MLFQENEERKIARKTEASKDDAHSVITVSDRHTRPSIGNNKRSDEDTAHETRRCPAASTEHRDSGQTSIGVIVLENGGRGGGRRNRHGRPGEREAHRL